MWHRRGPAGPPFEIQEGIRDQLPQPGQVFVLRFWDGSVCSERDHHVQPCFSVRNDIRRRTVWQEDPGLDFMRISSYPAAH